MTALSAETGKRYTEPDVEPIFVALLGETAKPSLASRRHPVDFTQWKPQVGKVDVVLRERSTKPHRSLS